MSKPCIDYDGDGYQEMFNDDQSDIITWICKTCNGTGVINAELPAAESNNDR